MADRGSKPKRKLTSKNTPNELETVPEFSEKWISVAAYYIWESEGQPEGQALSHWEEAKVQLAELWRAGELSQLE